LQNGNKNKSHYLPDDRRIAGTTAQMIAHGD